jgi:hypothetical protein
MKRSYPMPHLSHAGCTFAAAILATLLFSSLPARADIQVRIDIGNAPPPPRIVFLAPPHERRYAGDPVYVVDDPGIGDYDCFHYEGYYWVFRDGFWYRSAGWRGPFVVFDPHYVPAVFYREPATRWRHRPSGPPAFKNWSGSRSPQVAQRGYSAPQQPSHRNGSNLQQPTNRNGGRTSQVLNPRGSRQAQPANQGNLRPPASQPRGGNGSVGPARQGNGGSPGLAKKGGAPAGHPKKDAKGNDKGGGHGGN